MKQLSPVIAMILILLALFQGSFAVTITPNIPNPVRDSLAKDIMPFLTELSENTWSRKQREDKFSEISECSSTKSGLQYKNLKGEAFPVYNNIDSDSYVELNYKGILLDKSTFYDSWEKETSGTFHVASLFRGWKEALGYMKEGDMFLFYMPARLAYGSKGTSRIPPDSDLIMYVELVKLNAEPSIISQVKQWFAQDLYYPYLKVYHIFVFGGYLLFRRFMSMVLDRMLGRKPSKGKPKAKAKHILFGKEEEELCLKVKKELESDVSKFGEKAKEHSKCPSGKNGGDLGWFKKGAMVPAFDKVIFDPSSKLNQPLGPIETQFGFHLILIENVKGITETKKKQ